MELELRQDYISCWENAYSTTMEQEEVTEMIVPDAYPDILQILDGEGSMLLQRKEPLDGRAEVAGVIRSELLYQPEEGNGVSRLEVTQPFFCAVDAPALTRQCVLRLTPRVKQVEVQLLNPRKVMVRTKYSLALQAYSPERIHFCPMVEQAEPYGIYQKMGMYRGCLTTVVAEKSFPYSDTVNLAGGLPGMKELLRTRAEPNCYDTKLIGNKLVFKGETTLTLLYRAEDDSLCTTRISLPFSQIMDADDAGEDAICDLQLMVMELSCTPDYEDGRSLAVEVELLAQAVLSKTEEYPMLVDLYSTDYDLTPASCVYDVYNLKDQGTAQETLREVLETGIPVESILDVRVTPGRVTQSKEGGELLLSGEAEACILFGTEDGVQAIHRRIPVLHRIPAVEGADYVWDCGLYREATATPSGNGVELSCAVEFRWKALEPRKLSGIESATLEETKRRTLAETPSVIIRGVQMGESLWDIAKAYASTEAEIINTNALPSAELYPGQMLLIPKIRESAAVE